MGSNYYVNLCKTWLKTQDFKQAHDAIEQALEIDLKKYGEGHTDVARDLKYIGEVAAAQGKKQVANEAYQQALDIFLDRYGEQHPSSQELRKILDTAD